MAQLGWIIDLTKCVGCHTCEVACKSENNTYPQSSPLEIEGVQAKRVNWRQVLEIERGSYPNPAVEFVTMSCHHCAEPACMKSCPVDAITKRESDGVVLLDQDLCIGCRYCVWACPYGAPRFNSITGKVEKCTFCAHRLEVGLKPACVTTCIGRALDFGEEVGSIGQPPDGFADPSLTHPSVHFER